MKRIHILMMIIAAGILVFVPSALADPTADDVAGSDDTEQTESVSTEETTDTESTTPSDEEQAGGTEKCVDVSGCDSEPPCVEDCSETPCVDGCDEDVCTVDCEPVDEELPDIGPVELPEVDAPVAAGGALPFTGIEDILIPLALGLMGMIAGFVAYRYARLSDLLTRMRSDSRKAIEAEQGRSAYRAAARQLEDNEANAA